MGTIVLLASVTSAAAAQQAINERRAAPHAGAVRINNLLGTIKVIGWDRDSVWTSGTIPAGGGRFFSASGPNTKIGIDAPDSPATPGSDLVVYVPAASNVWIKGATSVIDVQGVTGGVDVSSVSGSVQVAGAPTTVNIESMDGNVIVDVMTPWLRVHSASGAITLVGSSPDLHLVTVGGMVTVTGKGGAFRRLNVESVSGDIQLSGELARDAKAEFETHSGNVGLQLAANLAAGFDLSSLQGTIFNQFGSGANAVTHTVRGAEAAFTVGSAGAEVKVRTFKGNIVLKRRKVAS